MCPTPFNTYYVYITHYAWLTLAIPSEAKGMVPALKELPESEGARQLEVKWLTTSSAVEHKGSFAQVAEAENSN